jgi:hypothetical protein
MRIHTLPIDFKIREILKTFKQQIETKNHKLFKTVARIKLLQKCGLISEDIDVPDVPQPELVTEAQMLDYLRKYTPGVGTHVFKQIPAKTAIQNKLTEIVVNTPGYYGTAQWIFEEVVARAREIIEPGVDACDSQFRAFYKGSTQMKNHLESFCVDTQGLYKNSDVDTCIVVDPRVPNYYELKQILELTIWECLCAVMQCHNDTIQKLFEYRGILFGDVEAIHATATNFHEVQGEIVESESEYAARCYQINVYIPDSNQRFNLSRVMIPYALYSPQLDKTVVRFGEFLDIVIVDKISTGHMEEAAQIFGF